jgi:methyl-accepting chemotaxis protein
MVSNSVGGTGYVFSIVAPVLDDLGKVSRMLCALVSWQRLLSPIYENLPLGHRERGDGIRVEFVSNSGLNLDSASADSQVKGLTDLQKHLNANARIEEFADVVMLNGKGSTFPQGIFGRGLSTSDPVPMSGNLVAVGGTPSNWSNGLENLHWSVIVSRRVDQIPYLVSLSRASTSHMLYWGIGAGLTAMLCAFILNRRVAASMDEVSGVLQQLAKGNLIARMDGSNSLLEWSLLSEKLNGAMDGICDSICNVANRLSALEWAAGELVTSGVALAGNARETSEIADATAASSEGVSANVSGVAAATEQMSTSIKDVARNASEASRVAQKAVDSASSAQRVVSRLGESSREISSVVSVIRGIAEQTSLLALNATLEAARAGEQGKGFAVVATEVKDLAKGTAVAIGEIEAKVGTLQEDCSGVISVLSDINEIILNINDLQSSIASAVEQQNASVHAISRNLVEASSGVSKISENITAVASAATQTLEGAESVKDAAGNVSLYTKEMQDSLVSYTFQ